MQTAEHGGCGGGDHGAAGRRRLWTHFVRRVPALPHASHHRDRAGAPQGEGPRRPPALVLRLETGLSLSTGSCGTYEGTSFFGDKC